MPEKIAVFFIISAAIVSIFLFLTFIADKIFSRGGRGMLSGLLVGKDNRLSLSKFQGVIWTLVAITSFITLKMVNVYCGVPINTEIPPNLLVLLGMNATTMVLAKGITSFTTAKGNIKLSSISSSVSDLYMADDKKSPDLVKFQMLCWTAVALTVYFINFFSQCGGEMASLGFPDIDGSLLYLMVIGQGVYLGDKAINVNKPGISGIIPLVVRPGEPFSILGTFVEGSTTFTLNKSVPLEVLGWDTSLDGLSGARVLIPAGYKITSSPAALTATTRGMVAGPYFVDIDLG